LSSGPSSRVCRPASARRHRRPRASHESGRWPGPARFARPSPPLGVALASIGDRRRDPHGSRADAGHTLTTSARDATASDVAAAAQRASARGPSAHDPPGARQEVLSGERDDRRGRPEPRSSPKCERDLHVVAHREVEVDPRSRRLLLWRCPRERISRRLQNHPIRYATGLRAQPLAVGPVAALECAQHVAAATLATIRAAPVRPARDVRCSPAAALSAARRLPARRCSALTARRPPDEPSMLRDEAPRLLHRNVLRPAPPPADVQEGRSLSHQGEAVRTARSGVSLRAPSKEGSW